MTAPPVGLPPGLFAFFDDLRGDNSKTFWAANKDRWEREVRTPFRSVVDVLAEEFGPLRVFRPNRDVRFSADKSPYRTWTGATSESHAVGGIGYYLEASAVGVVTGYGTMVMTPGQLRRFRAAVDDETSGLELRADRRGSGRALAALVARGRAAAADRPARVLRRPSPHPPAALEGGGGHPGVGCGRVDAHPGDPRGRPGSVARRGPAQVLAGRACRARRGS